MLTRDDDHSLRRSGPRKLQHRELTDMVENSMDRKKVCDELKINRAKLFGQFLKHPTDTRLALAIKLLDDQIADCTEWIRRKDKNVEIPRTFRESDKAYPIVAR